MTDLNVNFAPQKPLTVTELNRLVREVLEGSFPLCWVSGEISNLTRAASGHWYFSLKDNLAQVRCVMFKGKNNYLGWIPKEGDLVEARALVGLYEARGEFQLTIEFMQRAGLGILFEAFEQLKTTLSKEGLFDASRKQAIPLYPKQIGIVTSPDAAALHDVLTTLKRRAPSIPVVIYPTPVQGKGAAELIAKAITTAANRAECDVLIICRGGGSIEDLWQFNEEVVARAISACKIPTISGVGHETDFTIADFVADQRAPTPTAAAELASPDYSNLAVQLERMQLVMQRHMNNVLKNNMQQLDYLARRLISPQQSLRRQQETLMQLKSRLALAMTTSIKLNQQRIQLLRSNLQHLSPQGVLARGYAMVLNKQGQVITQANSVQQGENLDIALANGHLEVLVNKTSQ